jgi:hypothetical protein
MVPVVEDREELAFAREVGAKSGARERLCQRVGGETRLALLSVGDDRLCGLFEPVNRVLGPAPLDVEVARPESYWSDLAAASATADDMLILAAVHGRRWVAMAGSRWRTGETKLLPPDGTVSAFFLARSL